MQTHRRNSGDCFYNHRLDRGLLMESPPPSKLLSNDSSPVLMQPSSSSSGGGGGSSVGDGGLGYIEHTVSRFDTLAGVAIKYGVEVADIKRMNGLTTDLQMFALKTLQIPLPGRHPPSPVMSNGHDIQRSTKSESTPVSRRHSDLFDSIKSLKLSSSSPQNVSPSMDALRGYYGLKPTHQQNGLGEYGPGPKPSTSSASPPGLHRKCKSLAYGLSEKISIPVANGKEADSDKWYDKLIRRRKSEIDLKNHTPETMLKPDTTNATGAFSAAAGKGLALRPKAFSGSRTEDSSVLETAGGVKKSSSTPSFLDTENGNNNNNIIINNYNNNNNNNNNFMAWPTSMLNLTADLQALSTAAITRPIFDGLPRPMSGRKNKAAID